MFSIDINSVLRSKDFTTAIESVERVLTFLIHSGFSYNVINILFIKILFLGLLVIFCLGVSYLYESLLTVRLFS